MRDSTATVYNDALSHLQRFVALIHETDHIRSYRMEYKH